jgi:hypothetical protein
LKKGEGGWENTLIPIIISDHTKSLMSQEKIKHVHTRAEARECRGRERNFYITLQKQARENFVVKAKKKFFF